jgi:hypothetical protein
MIMPVLDFKHQRPKKMINPQKIAAVLLLGITLLSIMVFRSVFTVAAQSDSQELTSTPAPEEADVTPDGTLLQPQVTRTPRPEEVGSTTGIIIWGTALILILVAGTLLQTLRRKGQ